MRNSAARINTSLSNMMKRLVLVCLLSMLAFASQGFFVGQFIGKGEMIALGTLLTLGRRRLLPAAALAP